MNEIHSKPYAVDYLIVGAGVMGLAIARSLKKNQPAASILIVEKEERPGLHATGRNSGVLHAGFYYSPDSLKAQFCREGNLMLRELCRLHSIEILETGKVVVAQTDEEIDRLDQLYARGQANGVALELLSAPELENFEPLAVTKGKFLWSPNTAVASKSSITKALISEITRLDIQIMYSAQLKNFSENEVRVNERKIEFNHLINASGSGALKIAKKYGFGTNYLMIPFLGVYRTLPQKKFNLRTLVYPVPHPKNPFLGTHFTITEDGLVKLGPTAIPVLFGEQYKLLNGWNFYDGINSVRGLMHFFSADPKNVLSLIKSETPKLNLSRLIKSGAAIAPSASESKGWKKKPAAIRAQLFDLNRGELEQDFVVQGDRSSTHLLNTVSPGWTSSLAFAEWIVQRVLSRSAN